MDVQMDSDAIETTHLCCWGLLSTHVRFGGVEIRQTDDSDVEWCQQQSLASHNRQNHARRAPTPLT